MLRRDCLHRAVPVFYPVSFDVNVCKLLLIHYLSGQFKCITMAETNNSYEQLFFNDGYNLGNAITDASNMAAITHTTQQLYEQIDLLTSSFLERCNRNGVSVDCKMGCAWCCHQPVFALTHEILIIAEYISQRFSKETIALITEKAAKKSAYTRALTGRELLTVNQPCPLLRNGACSVYQVRPMACRIYLSSDVKTCIQKYDTPANPKVKPALFGFMLDAGRHLNHGFVTALDEKKIVSKEAPLEWMLHDFIQDTSLIQKWLNGDTLNESYHFDL